MIISASRRTDIPAFYARWFMNRIRDGYCLVPNPFNPKQISRISLTPEDVDGIVFWTRYAAPLLPFLPELDQRGYRYYFLYTLMNNPRALELKKPSHQKSLSTFQALSSLIGKEKVIWRYDPVVITPITDLGFHRETYHHIAENLQGYTVRSVISRLDVYRKIKPRLRRLEDLGINVINPSVEELSQLMNSLADAASQNGMRIQSCAETPDLQNHGITPGKCIDDHLLHEIFGIHVTSQKDPSQRKLCYCVASRDIGMYDTCRFECVYCYATSSFENARSRQQRSCPDSPYLTGGS